jgi:putative FmdB family regulatory protein
MPTYDYLCKECGHKFEAFQSMSDAALAECPQCHAPALQRLIGAGAGLLFKGSGFYLTDYKKSGSSPAKAGGESSSAAPPPAAPADASSPSATVKPDAPSKQE